MDPPHTPSASRSAGPRGSDAGRPATSTVVAALAVVVAAALLAGCLGSDPGTAGGPAGDAEASGEPDEGSQGYAGGPGADGDATRTETPWTGAWLGQWPDPRNETIDGFANRTGHRPAKVNLQVPWNTSYDSLEPTLENLDEAGATPLVTWYPSNLTTAEIRDDSTRVRLDDGRNVTVEEYVDSYARGICRYHERTGRTVLLEPMPEPNGDWHAWAVGYQDPATGSQPNSAQDYVAAWRMIHDRFTTVCPDGAEFLWTVNAANQGSGTAYDVAYPGDVHVDLVGIRGVNMGPHQGEEWASFATTFGDAYCTLTQITRKDVVLAGIGSVEDGGDKARWIRSAYRNASSHQWHRIQGVVWYDDTLEVDGRTLDLSLDSSPEALEAYRKAVDRLEDGEIAEGTPPPC